MVSNLHVACLAEKGLLECSLLGGIVMCRVDVVCPPFHIFRNRWLSKASIHEVHSFCNHDILHLSCVSVPQRYQTSKRIRVWLKLHKGQKECVRHTCRRAVSLVPWWRDLPIYLNRGWILLESNTASCSYLDSTWLSETSPKLFGQHFTIPLKDHT